MFHALFSSPSYIISPKHNTHSAVGHRTMMEATLVPPCKSLFVPPLVHGRCRAVLSMQNIRRADHLVQSVLTDKNNLKTSSSSSTNESKNVYKDNWFQRLAIKHLSSSLQASTGLISNKSGYDGLMEAAAMTSECFSPMEQRKLVTKTLETAFPGPILRLIKTMVRPSKFAREYFAVFTTIFFPWLIGPCQVSESEFEGRKEKNVVHIPKCRFLEGTNCVGMCTNLCKMPSQSFIKDTLGMPINMVPNFDDMSCEMIFGQEPPEEDSDPAFAQPCYKQCKATKRHQKICTT